MKNPLVIITGMSGSGKSIALRALEDTGYYSVDNLPPQLLLPLLELQKTQGSEQLAVAIDVRSSHSLTQLPELLEQLRAQGHELQLIFLDASNHTLVRRFSETRRNHPLSSAKEQSPAQDLLQAIDQERQLLRNLREQAHTIDTSYLLPTQLRSYIKQMAHAPAASMTVVLESFGFKHGLAMDADFVFDVRMLPNPYYEPALRPLSGLDEPVAQFLQTQENANKMLTQILAFLRTWLPELLHNHRSYVTVAIGCTGGQHRSVWMVEQLARQLRRDWSVIVRHRELDARSGPNSAKQQK